MDAPADELLSLLNLQSAGEGVFTGPPSPEPLPRVFGGQVLAQALAAASFTVQDAVCHSLHAYFVRPGKPGRPIDYEVSAVRDGQSFSVRKVIAVQRDEVNLELIASFQSPSLRTGAEHAIAMPDVPPPESFPSEDERIAEALADSPPEQHVWIARKRPIETIRIDRRSYLDRTPSTEPLRVWMRTRGRLMDDPNLHRCALTYASDMGLLEPSLRAVGTGFGDSRMQVASLDHALWFHRPFRFDDWLLFYSDSASVAEGRGLSRGSVFDREGKLVASIAQEGVMRLREE